MSDYPIHPPGFFTLAAQFAYPVLTNLMADFIRAKGQEVIHDCVEITFESHRPGAHYHVTDVNYRHAPLWDWLIAMGFPDGLGGTPGGKYIYLKGKEGVFFITTGFGVHRELLKFTGSDEVSVLGAGDIAIFPNELILNGFSEGLRGMRPHFHDLDKIGLLKHLRMPHGHLVSE
jgi:hypothetical protein